MVKLIPLFNLSILNNEGVIIMLQNIKNDIQSFKPSNEQEEKDKIQFLKFLEEDNILSRENKVAHVTVSAFVLNKTHNKVLMAYHNIYDSWAWLGGHADGHPDLLEVALKEIEEESGLTDVSLIEKSIFSLEILTVDGHVKRGEYVSSHLHLNVTYLFEGDDEAPLRVKEDENSKVGWIPLDKLDNYVSEEWILENVYQKIMRKCQQMYGN